MNRSRLPSVEGDGRHRPIVHDDSEPAVAFVGERRRAAGAVRSMCRASGRSRTSRRRRGRAARAWRRWSSRRCGRRGRLLCCSPGTTRSSVRASSRSRERSLSRNSETTPSGTPPESRRASRSCSGCRGRGRMGRARGPGQRPAECLRRAEGERPSSHGLDASGERIDVAHEHRRVAERLGRLLRPVLHAARTGDQSVEMLGAGLRRPAGLAREERPRSRSRRAAAPGAVRIGSSTSTTSPSCHSRSMRDVGRRAWDRAGHAGR